MPVVLSPALSPAHSRRPNRLFCLAPLALALAACGGGGSDPVAPGQPPATTALTLSGTAATGAAIAGRLVEARCSGGNGSATSGPDGGYTIAVSVGQLPCVLRVTTAGGDALHSVATGSGASARANITPVSELVLAKLSGGAPASYFGAFDSAAAAALTATKADAAVTAVVAMLQAAGLDFGTTGNVLTAALVAANGSTSGNPFDLALDALQTKLGDRGISLAQLAETVAISSPAAPASALRNTPSLPAEMLLQPAASNCSALRSGRYRLVYNRNHARSEGHDTTLVSIDAVALTTVDEDGNLDRLTPNGNCRFKTPDNGDMVVSQAGIIVLQVSDVGGLYLGLAFPEQTHPLSALAGEWNSLQLERTEDTGPIVLTNGTWTLDTSGRLTAATFCEPGVDCFSGTLAATTGFPLLTHTVHPAGGFTSGDASAGYSDRVFLYRSGGGELLRINLTDAGGHLGLSTRKVANTLPEEGRVADVWIITQNNNYTASSITDAKNTVRTLDSSTGSFLRDALVDSSTGLTRPETLRINAPRAGYNARVGETVTASDGSRSAVAQFVALGLRGTGISAVGFPGNNTLVLSVGK